MAHLVVFLALSAVPPHLAARGEEPPDEAKERFILDAFGQQRHQLVVIDGIKEVFQVDIDHPDFPLGDKLAGLLDGVFGAAFGTKAVALVRERGVNQGSQDLNHGLLHEAIDHRWDAQMSWGSIGFQNRLMSNRLRLIAAVPKGFCRFFQDGFEVLLDFLNADVVDACRAFISFDGLKGALEVTALGDFRKKKVRWSWFCHKRTLGLLHHRGDRVGTAVAVVHVVCDVVDSAIVHRFLRLHQM